MELPEEVKYVDLRSLKNAEGLELLDGIDMDKVYLPEEIKIELLAKQSSKKRKKYFNWLKQ